MSYRVELRKSAAKEVAAVPLGDRRRIVDRIAGLATDPRPDGAILLKGSEAYRLRQGDYRIVYTIDDDRVVVTIVRVAHRREVYR